MSKFRHVPLLLFLLTGFVASQTPRIIDRPLRPPVSQSDIPGNFIVGEVKGTVPSKAIYLAKPEYPADARWAGAEGVIRVEVEIDAEGNVTKTTVVSGEAVLRPVVIDAAKRSKFRIARNAAGEPIIVTGVLVYDFEIRPAGWVAIGWGLSGLEILPASTLPIPAVRKAFGRDWQAERDLLDKIDTIRKNTPALGPPTFIRGNPSTIRPPLGQAGQSVSRGRVNLPAAPPSELKVASAQLVTAVRGRLAGEPFDSWRFGLGIGLRNAIDQYRNPYSRAQASATVKGLIDSAPKNASAATLKNLREIESVVSNGRTAASMYDLATPVSAILSER